MNDLFQKHLSQFHQLNANHIVLGAAGQDAPEEDFPRRLAELRKEKGLKHDSLSDLTKLVDPRKRGIARTTLRGYELGITKPGIRELRILSEALEVSADKLVFGVEYDAAPASREAFAIVKKNVLGKREEEVVEIARFLVALCRLGDQDRSGIYKITSSLAAAKLGEVEFRTIMDSTQETVEKFIDAHEELLTADTPRSLEQVKALLCPLAIAVLENFGCKLRIDSAAKQ